MACVCMLYDMWGERERGEGRGGVPRSVGGAEAGFEELVVARCGAWVLRVGGVWVLCAPPANPTVKNRTSRL